MKSHLQPSSKTRVEARTVNDPNYSLQESS